MWPDYEKPNNLKDLYKRFNIYERDINNFEKVFLKENEYILIDNAEQEIFFDDAEREIDDWWAAPNTGHNVTVVKVTRITT